jgi:hypothetical protein
MLRKLARVMLNVLTAVSLAVCVAACVMWVRSFIVSDHWSWVHDDSARDVGEFGVGLATSDAGAVRFALSELTLFQGPVDPDYARSVGVSGSWSKRPPHRETWRENLTPWVAWERTAADASARALRLPYWLIVIGSAALPAARLAGRRRWQRRLARGLCPGCGYDLTGNVSGTCPECGTAAAANGAKG